MTPQVGHTETIPLLRRDIPRRAPDRMCALRSENKEARVPQSRSGMNLALAVSVWWHRLLGPLRPAGLVGASSLSYVACRLTRLKSFEHVRWVGKGCQTVGYGYSYIASTEWFLSHPVVGSEPHVALTGTALAVYSESSPGIYKRRRYAFRSWLSASQRIRDSKRRNEYVVVGQFNPTVTRAQMTSRWRRCEAGCVSCQYCRIHISRFTRLCSP